MLVCRGKRKEEVVMKPAPSKEEVLMLPAPRKKCCCAGCSKAPCGACAPCVQKHLHRRCKERACVGTKGTKGTKGSPVAAAVQKGVKRMKSPTATGSKSKKSKKSPPPSAANSPVLKRRLRSRKD